MIIVTRSKKKIIAIATATVLFAVGLGLYLYPVYTKKSFEKNAQAICDNFNKTAAEARKNPIAEDVLPEKEKRTEDKYSRLYYAMKRYNEELYKNGQKGLRDQLAYETPDFLLSDYGVNNGEVLATVEIPKLKKTLPVLNGAGYDNMLKGAVCLAKTSLPIGGENTNCVIAAHNIWNGVEMFMRISELSVGDVIYIENFWGRLEYRVIETKIIDPDCSKEIFIRSGKSLLTLSTCYPYPDNGKRQLVFAEQK